MTNDPNDPLRAPDCMQEDTRLIQGTCSNCGAELEFFSVSELRQTGHCPNCKQHLDVKSIADKAGVSI
ncbi:hypothetical protein C4J81_10530 [Deltaproteobacteria bacterium Smac51]|nr:hypothetical protein C4J81_10530 [Deltaproteobacteria bacterium Smac51]